MRRCRPSVLTPPDGNGHGVLAEYFDNAELKGEPRLHRVEARPYMPSGLMDPAVAAAVPGRGYSVRWTGALRAPFTGDYVLGARGGRGATVFLDEKEVLGDSSPQGMGRVREAHAQLEAGHRLQTAGGIQAIGTYGRRSDCVDSAGCAAAGRSRGRGEERGCGGGVRGFESKP
jgi:hypothetical protein